MLNLNNLDKYLYNINQEINEHQYTTLIIHIYGLLSPYRKYLLYYLLNRILVPAVNFTKN